MLIPRPDSETLIEAAVEHFGDARARRAILDLGTGPGTLLLAALDQWPQATRARRRRFGSGARLCARAMPTRLGLADRADFRLGDWGDGLDERFDLILCNPPYVEAGAELAPDVARLGAGRGALCRAGRARRLSPARAAARRAARAGRHRLRRDRRRPGGGGPARCSTAQGFTIASRRDLSGVARCLILTA